MGGRERGLGYCLTIRSDEWVILAHLGLRVGVWLVLGAWLALYPICIKSLRFYRRAISSFSPCDGKPTLPKLQVLRKLPSRSTLLYFVKY